MLFHMLRIESALCQYGIREAAEALERSAAASSLSERKRGQILKFPHEFLADETARFRPQSHGLDQRIYTCQTGIDCWTSGQFLSNPRLDQRIYM
jgi:hypothetical protein